MSRAEALLRRLAGSAYAALAVRDDLLIDVIAGDWAARIRSPAGRVSVVLLPGDTPESVQVPSEGPALDGTIRCSPTDLDRMLGRLAPQTGVSLTHGDRDIAPRRRQAHLVMVAAALGWDGPWPRAGPSTGSGPPLAPPAGSGSAVDHRALLVEALCDLAIGPRDRGFIAGGLPVRGTDTAAGLTLVLDAGLHAVRLDLRPGDDVNAALSPLARLGLRLIESGAPRGDAWFGEERWSFSPDPAFPRGWTMPDGVGGVWRVTRG